MFFVRHREVTIGTSLQGTQSMQNRLLIRNSSYEIIIILFKMENNIFINSPIIHFNKIIFIVILYYNMNVLNALHVPDYYILIVDTILDFILY